MELQIIKHSELLLKDLLRAISVKSVAWPHPVESQFKWIIDNMQPGDMHVFLCDKGIDKAYMTLTPVEGVVDGQKMSFWGVGCVCAAERGKGLGTTLIRKVNDYLISNSIPGILLCKRDLVPFYHKNNWREIPNQTELSDTIHVMVLGTGINAPLQKINRVF